MRVHVRRRVKHGGVSQFEIHADSISVNRRSSKARASVSSPSSITSGGARMIRLPRAAKDTPLVRAFLAQDCQLRRRLRPGRQWRARYRVADQLDHGEQSVTTPHIANDAMSLLELFQLDQHCTTQTARTLDQFFIFIGAHRGQSSGACQGMATVSQAGEEHLRFQLPGDISVTTAQPRAANAHRSAPLPVSSGRVCRRRRIVPGKPLAAAAKATHYFIGNQEDIARTGQLAQSPASNCPAPRCHWCRR